MMKYCIDNKEPFGVVLIREGSEVGGGAVPFDIGTTAHITQIDEMDDGRMNIATLGLNRFRIIDLNYEKEPYLVGTIEDYPLIDDDKPTISQEALALRPILIKYLDTVTRVTDLEFDVADIPSDAKTLAFLTAIVMRNSMEDKQALLSKERLSDLLKQERIDLLEETRTMQLLTATAPHWRNDSATFSPN